MLSLEVVVFAGETQKTIRNSIYRKFQSRYHATPNIIESHKTLHVLASFLHQK